MPSSYVIGEHFEQFIKSQIQQGRYASASEVIRDGLRVLEDQGKLRAAKLEALRADIQQGLNSGPGRPVQDVAAKLQARYQHWAEQGAPVMRCELSPQALQVPPAWDHLRPQAEARTAEGVPGAASIPEAPPTLRTPSEIGGLSQPLRPPAPCSRRPAQRLRPVHCTDPPAHNTSAT